MTKRNPATLEPSLALLLDYLKSERGFDFSGYKTASLERRVRRRMVDVDIQDYAAYQDYLEANPGEFRDLFDTILINVTGFFRERPAWDYLAGNVVPQLLDQVPNGEPIRIWSAACASGEEAYTLAMTMAEAMGEAAFRERVKVYATDVDERALATARQATYSSDDLKPVPDELRERYFETSAAGHTFRGELRRSVIFGRNDLVQDAPISRVDLLVSRNTLMYFNPETQARILRHFNFALKDDGFLFLGKSEMLLTHGDLFRPRSLRDRVFTKVVQRGLRERLALIGEDLRLGVDAPSGGDSDLRAAAADVTPVAQLVVERGGFLAAANQRARKLFGLATADVGRPLQDLEVSYRPVELRSALDRAYEAGEPITVGPEAWQPAGGDQVILTMRVTPMPGNGDYIGASVTFEDVSAYAQLDEEHRRSKRELEHAYEELQSTVEELETTNEELQSTNEELETTNEELQSTNEELETTNEELQSTNDELETMNDDERDHVENVARLNSFLEGVLGNLGVGVVVVDGDTRVTLWNAASTDLWGVRADEAEGRRLEELDVGLPVAELAGPIQATIADGANGEALTVSAVNRRGRQFQCFVRMLPLTRENGDRYGALVLAEDREG